MMNINNYGKEIWSRLDSKIPKEQFTYIFNSFLNSYFEIIPIVKKKTKILDVGCGGGLLIDYLKIHGFDIEGCDNYQYDYNTKKTIEVLKNYKSIHQNDIYNFSSNKKYDLILLSNVIEHLDDWKEGLRLVKKLLNKNGQIILLFPNYSFKVEMHFMIPILFNKNITYYFMKNIIKNTEIKNNRVGLWKSLNFVKPSEISNFFLEDHYHVTFDKDYNSRLVKRLIESHRKKEKNRNLLHFFLFSTAKLISTTGLISLYKYFPIMLHPFVKMVIYKK